MTGVTLHNIILEDVCGKRGGRRGRAHQILCKVTQVILHGVVSLDKSMFEQVEECKRQLNCEFVGESECQTELQVSGGELRARWRELRVSWRERVRE